MEKINWKKHLKVSATVVALVAGATVVWASGGGNGEAVHHNAWKDVDTWKVLNFVLLALGCFFIAKKPVAQFFSSRTKGIEEELTDLEQKKAEAERKLAEYQARFRNLEQESEQIIEDYIKQGEDAKKRIIAEAEAQAEN
ncbi:MAG TPA: ATP synthase F0 subunit B, partial [Desulfobacter postgatei]|nr:ATP synthase F0 subunit B [Desulfobacter postgatei]